jgi:hypothetical protein
MCISLLLLPCTTLERQKINTHTHTQVLQNVGIALAKFRLPIRDIKAAVLAMDDSVLSLEMAKSLANQRPTSEDKSTLSDFEGDVATLGKVEQFFLEVVHLLLPWFDEPFLTFAVIGGLASCFLQEACKCP